MNDTTIGVGIVVLFFLTTWIGMWSENRKRNRKFLDKLKKSWGRIPDREYTYEELEHISQYFVQRKKDGFYIDDITWNDLDMDRIFILLNQSSSSVGESCLYDILRNPVDNESELQERHRLIEFFRENETARQKMQKLLSHIKKPGNVSVFEAIHAATEVSVQSSKRHILFCIAFFASLLFFMIEPSKGVGVFLAVCVLNIITYRSKDSQINVFLTSFRCVMELLLAQKEFEKLDMEQLRAYQEESRTYAGALAGFKRGSSIVINGSGLSGGLEGMIMDYVRMLTHIDLIKFNDMMRNMQAKQEEIHGLLRLFGYLDSMISIASYREAAPYYSIPEFEDKGRAYMEVEELYHPLIANPVPNSIRAKTGILVTGSNASGKSTFLKNIAINTVLSQTIYTAAAKRYRAPFYKVMTSMALRDDLQTGESYYIVEIRSLKRIMEETEKEGYLLCIIDEVLRGTNTIERIGASSQILAEIRKENVLPFAATHDIELSYILEQVYENYHFEEEVGSEDVVFNYLLKKGRVTTRNAIRLLEMIGYDRNLVQNARESVRCFEETGVWSKVEQKRE